VLLVEDDPLVRSVLERLLRAMGHRVESAESGDAALELLAHDAPPLDLLVTDVLMPGINGPELADRLVASLPDLRVIFVSGYSEFFAQEGDMSTPGRVLLAKPFTSEQFESALRALTSTATGERGLTHGA